MPFSRLEGGMEGDWRSQGDLVVPWNVTPGSPTVSLPLQPHATVQAVGQQRCDSLSHWKLFDLCLNSIK